MNVEYKVINDSLEIQITGHITGITEVVKLKEITAAHPHVHVLKFTIIDAFVIPSSLIGHLVMEVKQNKKKIIFNSPPHHLKELINDLNLQSIIEVQ